MSPLAFTFTDLWHLAAAVFFIVVGLALGYTLVQLGGTLGRVSAFIRETQNELMPVINNVGGTVDRVNRQMDKVDTVTDSAVDAAESVDTAIRAVSIAITRPVQKLSGLAAGIAYGAADLKAHRDVGGAVRAAKEAAARREAELEDELRRAGSS